MIYILYYLLSTTKDAAIIGLALKGLLLFEAILVLSILRHGHLQFFHQISNPDMIVFHDINALFYHL